MKIATAGKGGSGKTTIAGSLSRILARKQGKILAIDGDPNPNLAFALGIPTAVSNTIPSIPSSLMQVVEDPDGEKRLVMSISQEELISNYAAGAPDGIELIVMGQPAHGSAGSGCMCASHRAVRGLIGEMSGYGEHTVTDMEAGLEHLKRGTVRNVDVMLVVAEPYYRSLEAAERTISLGRELEIPHVYVVSNKVKNKSDQAAIESFCSRHNLSILGMVPHDETFIEAERNERSPIDFAPDSPGVQAISEIASKLIALDSPQTRQKDESLGVQP